MTKPTENEMFEQSVLEAIISAIESYEKNDLDGWELYLVKRRAELVDQEIAQYKAQINELREALSEIHECLMVRGGGDEYLVSIVDKALAKTAPKGT